LDPFVEICPRNILCTDECPVLDIDLQTIKKEDLDFASQYSLRISQDGYINGLVVWFDTYFSFGSRPITLTTRNIAIT
jgi:type I protein arginine methyltransferase